ncbi:RidA family protein [Aerococcaceae bacterium WGS1372]
MVRKIFTATNATSSGPYSHAVDGGDYIFFSGQTAMNSDEPLSTNASITDQTKEVFANLTQVMDQAGLTSDDVVKVNVYLTDMADFEEMNEVYTAQFNEPYPARTCVAVKALPFGASVEIEMIAKSK